MRSIKRGLAVLLAVLLMMPAMPVSAQEITDTPANVMEITSEVTLEETSEIVSEIASEEVSVIVNEEVSEAVSEEISEEASEVVSEEISEEVSEVVSEEISEEASEVVLEEISEEVNEVVSEEISEEASEVVLEEISEEVSEAVSEEISEEASEVVSEEISEEASEVVSEEVSDETVQVVLTEEVFYNTGTHDYSVVDADAYAGGLGDDVFAEDGSYTIVIPEENPFFPYEVQFTYDGIVTNEWFMTPDDSVVIDGHTFYVSAKFDNTVVTQMTLNVAGDTVVVYPEAKEFLDYVGPQTESLLPLEERSLSVDLSGYSPLDLAGISIESLLTGDNAVADTDKVIWKYTYDENYTISESGDCINLGRGSSYEYSSNRWEIIVGEADQLAADNIRYNVDVSTSYTEEWLIPTVYSQKTDGTRSVVSLDSFDYNDYYNDRSSMSYPDLSFTIKSSEYNYANDYFVGLALNKELFSFDKYSSVKVYEGKDATGTDITNKIFASNMSVKDAGYSIDFSDKFITLVGLDENGKNIAQLTIELELYTTGYSIDPDYLYSAKGTASTYSYESGYEGDFYVRKYVYTVAEEAKADDIHFQRMELYEGSDLNNELVLAVYAGLYNSLADAKATGFKDIKASMFGEKGYGDNYSKGIYFTIFYGQSENSYSMSYYYIQTKEAETGTGNGTGSSESLNSGTSFYFNGINDKDGASVKYWSLVSDSYASDYKYLTYMVPEDVDTKKLAISFSTSEGAKVYTAGQKTPEVSGKTTHDFSKGAIQYTISSEDGENSVNYWIQIIKPSTGNGKLFMNSLADETSGTKTENNVIYTTREVMLDSYHYNAHTIVLANMGGKAIPNLSVELKSDQVVLDEYWTLSGKHDLSSMASLEEGTTELANMAKIRLIAKEGVERGTDVTGTLTFKSGDTTLMVVTLTGTVGDPCIVTKDIPEAVKYVPYGTMIQNNNKYSWNTITYGLTSYLGKDGYYHMSELPEGVILKENGEIYGVPKEIGEFTFAVYMYSSYYDFSSDTKTYTLIVKENTDVNVDGATDDGYDISQRIADITINNTADKTVVSQGEYGEFVDVYLDGVKLVAGTDYTSEEGSTRITIKAQTLVQSGADSVGTHTIGIEFRTDADTLKKAAQNYDIVEKETSNDNNNSNDNNTNNGGNSNSGSSSNSGTGSSSNASTSVDSIADVSKGVAPSTQYTVESGDTLWKIAQKFYGDGNMWRRIFDDNASVISDPNKIYVGQVLTLYPTTSSTEGSTATSNVVVGGDTYTVQSGDSLWKIAEKTYGNGKKWRDIYNANKDVITSPERIYAGQVLKLPE